MLIFEPSAVASKLWAVFDWSARGDSDHRGERRELQVRLAEVALPDNYAQAAASGAFAKEYDPAKRDRVFLPPELFQPRGPRVCIKGDQRPVAESHVGSVYRAGSVGKLAFFFSLPKRLRMSSTRATRGSGLAFDQSATVSRGGTSALRGRKTTPLADNSCAEAGTNAGFAFVPAFTPLADNSCADLPASQGRCSTD